MSIVPDDAPLLIEAWLDNEDVGQVEVGQQVEIKVATYPFEQFGTLRGRLVWISPDAQEKAAEPNATTTDANTHASTYRYKVHIQPEAIAPDRTSRLRLGTGMAVSADIKIGHRKVIDFVLSPLLKNLKTSVNGK